jgi:cold shock CspA family protein
MGTYPSSVKYSGRDAEGTQENSGERSSSEFQGVAESGGRSKPAIFGRDEDENTKTPEFVGKVKWFNNKSGFGFITICDGELATKDIFVHYSSIQVSDLQYKYLVEGEYVNFDLAKPANSTHEFHAVNVCGIKGGALMCETRKPNFIRDVVSPGKREEIQRRSRTSGGVCKSLKFENSKSIHETQ